MVTTASRTVLPPAHYVIRTSPVWKVVPVLTGLLIMGGMLLADHVGNSWRCSELHREHSVYAQTYCR